jgi:hypothetical protein
MVLEIVPASDKAASGIGFGDIVPASADTGGDALQRKPNIVQIEVDYFNPIAGTAPASKPGGIGQPAKCALKGEIFPGRGEAVQLGKEQAAGSHACGGGIERRQPGGQMSAWYIFTALGFYRVCPASDYYVIGSPATRKAVMHLSNGRKFTMLAENLSDQNIYVQAVKLNGKNWEQPFLPYRAVTKGGTFVFTMGPQPNKQWGANCDVNAALK